MFRKWHMLQNGKYFQLVLLGSGSLVTIYLPWTDTSDCVFEKRNWTALSTVLGRVYLGNTLSIQTRYMIFKVNRTLSRS